MPKDALYEAIERRAYELYEQRGRQDGRDWEDWLQAESELEADLQHDVKLIEAPPTTRRRRAEREPEFA